MGQSMQITNSTNKKFTSKGTKFPEKSQFESTNKFQSQQIGTTGRWSNSQDQEAGNSGRSGIQTDYLDQFLQG